MDAIQFLKQEHKKAKAGIKKVLKASPEERGDLWTDLEPELEAHEQIEDACLYGPLARGEGKADAKLAAWRGKHQKEVERVEALVKQIDGLDPAEAGWLAKVKAVGASLEKHIREEEGEIFPRIGKAWDKARLKEAGAEMAEMKAEKLHA
jgi:hemerythrin HHE cation binding domain-containing protein